MTYDAKTENFIAAFSSGSAGIVRTCECGNTYYDSSDEGCFDPGELEKLQSNPIARDLGYSVGTVVIHSKEYVIDCDCWKKRGKDVAEWLDNHRTRIADYFAREKARLTREALALPSIEP